MDAVSGLARQLFAEMGKIVVGQERLKTECLIVLLCEGHALIEGVPGLAKTLAVKTLARLLQLDFQRVQGTADLMRSMGIRITAQLATADKFVRAQPAAAAWQQGKIRVPRGMPWTADLVQEIGRFTGQNDRHDDIVDALSSAVSMTNQGVYFR